MGRQPAAVCKQKLRKGLWSPEEDEKLLTHISTHGVGRWSSVPKQAGLQRCGKSCRLRWRNYLRPDIKRGSFSQEEEDTIIRLHRVRGNRWSLIAARLPGRTDNDIKNFWNTKLKKKLGVDQDTHGDGIPDGDGIPAGNDDDRRRQPVFHPFPAAAAAADLDYPFLAVYHYTDQQQHGPPRQELMSEAFDDLQNSTATASSGPSSYGGAADVAAGSSNHSCGKSSAAGAGGLGWYAESNADDEFLRLIHADRLGLLEDQQGLELSTLINKSGAGGELDCESRAGFL